jgi:hypothetical protein
LGCASKAFCLLQQAARQILFPAGDRPCPQRIQSRAERGRAGASAGAKAQPAGGGVKVIPLSRANNISIMLTQFAGFKRGPADIRRALVSGSKSLGTERLSLLLQVGAAPALPPLPAVMLSPEHHSRT